MAVNANGGRGGGDAGALIIWLIFGKKLSVVVVVKKNTKSSIRLTLFKEFT